jgi:chemotaxis protein MotB
LTTPPAQLTEIELTAIPTIPDPAPNVEEAGGTPALQTLQGFHTSVVERTTALEQTLTSALNQQAEAEVVRQQQLSSLVTTRDALGGQITALAEEKAGLTAQLASERQRGAALAEQLQEAQQEKERELSSMKGTYDHPVVSLQTEISQKEIALHQTNERLTVTILDRVLFPSGQATLTPEGEQVMGKVASVLTKMGDRRILIEGHTDNVAIGTALSARFPTNWELSTARATEVVKYLISHTQLPASRLSAVGRADTAPIANNATEEGRRLNRRIELIVLPPDNPTMGLS